MKLRTLTFLLVAAATAHGATEVTGLDFPAPKIDGKRIINESYNFRRNQEPEMTADEYAIYERLGSMVAVNPQFAMKLVETMTSAEKPSAAFEFVLGNLYFSSERFDQAETHFRRAIAGYPDFIRAWSNLAVLLYNQRRFGEAAECLTKVISAGENNAQNLGLLAYCLEKTGRRTGAEMAYVQAIGLDPDNADLLGGLLAICMDSKQYGRAEGLLQQLIRLRPDDARTWVVYASLLTTEDRKLEALALLESAAALKVADEEALSLLCDLYASQRFYREANETFERLRARSPAAAAGKQLFYARALIGEGRLDPAGQALDALERADVPPANRAAVLLARGDYQLARKAWTEAAATFQKVMETDPLNSDALLGAGLAAKSAGDPARAEVLLDQASQQPASAHRAYIELADLAIKSRRYARAIDCLERANAIEKSSMLDGYIARLRPLLQTSGAAAPAAP